MKNPSMRIKQLLDINGPKIRELREKIARQEIQYAKYNYPAKEIIGKHIKRLKTELKKYKICKNP